MRRPYAALVAAALLLAACGTETSDPGGDPAADPTSPVAPTAMPTDIPAADGEVTTGGPVTVLDDAKGAEACLGGVADSLPPQCGGPKLIGWDWADHQGDFEERSGTRWGDFVITGTFDGQDITPTEVVPAAEWEPIESPDEDFSFETPCPEPDGGWTPVDPAATTQRTLDHAIQIASALPDYAGVWVDQSINPAYDDPDDVEKEYAMNDPKLLVLNVAVTDDVAGAEAAIREVWGGALCVTEARHTERELLAIQEELAELPGILGGDASDDRVSVYVTFDDGSTQVWADQEYGAGVVEVSSALVSVDD
jgi:hypothetical protein